MKSLVNVAVAVLYYQHQFLLAYRSPHLHQGGKLEFVGGKIEKNENEINALVREVGEELGLDIGDNSKQKLGDIVHDYGDKSIKLCVYAVVLNHAQALEFQQKTHGKEGQTLHWLTKTELLNKADELPQANVQILEWIDDF